MLKYSQIEKFDPSGMHKVYDIWPKLAQESFETKQKILSLKGINHVVFCGMGGSGTIGDMLASILSQENIHVNVVKGYVLPKTITPNSLVVATSVSGNTEETLALLKKAQKTNCKIIGFSSGGKLEIFCKNNSLEYRKIPQNHSPRASFASYIFYIVKTLKEILPIDGSIIKSTIDEMKKISKIISSNNLSSSNTSLELANSIYDDIISIYCPWGLSTPAIRFKNSLQENAKMHAFVEDVIEACHNSVVAWDSGLKIKSILIRGTDDNPKTKQRWEILKQFFDSRKIKYTEIHSVSGNIFKKIVCLIYVLDYCSIYRSILSNIDPTPVTPIDYIKSKLEKNIPSFKH